MSGTLLTAHLTHGGRAIAADNCILDAAKAGGATTGFTDHRRGAPTQQVRSEAKGTKVLRC